VVSQHNLLTSGENNDKLLARFQDEVEDGWRIILDLLLGFPEELPANLLEHALDE